jgi:hypothetical protein
MQIFPFMNRYAAIDLALALNLISIEQSESHLMACFGKNIFRKREFIKVVKWKNCLFK